MNRRITIFSDFDGVLFNTIKEAYVLCRHAYNDVDYYADIDENEYRKFYRYKFLVYNSWQYYYIMKLIGENLSDDEFVAEYDKCMNNRDLSSEKDFDKKYYSGREDLIQNHNEYWNKLEKPFDFFYTIKSLYENGKIDIVIISKKNKDAILYRVNQYGLALPKENVVGKEELEGYGTKAEYMNKYMRANKIERAYFVDDNSNNLTPCREYDGIEPILAGWGNVGIDEIGLTENQVKEVIES